jgi:shikimate dehydrogenase
MTGRRSLVGLIGANIMSSLSPALQEDAFAAAGIRGTYHLMDLDRLPGRRLEHLMAAVKAAGFDGINVTFPCKTAVLPLLEEISDDARQIGAVNCVTIANDGRTVGYNTDRIGFRRNFEDGLGRTCIEGKTAVLIGNGSARCRLVDSLPDAIATAAGVVNATPVGMQGIPGNPVPVAALGAHHWVADVIYTPIETQLIEAARAAGARVLTGGGMCVHQAAETFRLFTGVHPDVERMHRTFAAALAERDAAQASAT